MYLQASASAERPLIGFKATIEIQSEYRHDDVEVLKDMRSDG